MSTLATIDVTIPGNVEQIHLVASWLGKLRDDLWEAKDLLSNNKNLAFSKLKGELADAIHDYYADMEKTCENTYNRTKTANEIIHAFADQLSSRKSDMADHLETAKADKLKTDGNIIYYPDPVSKPGDFPKNGTKAQKVAWDNADNAYEDFQAKVRDFNKINGRVEATYKRLTDWIESQLAPAANDVQSSLFSGALKGIVTTAAEKAGRPLIKTAYETASDHWEGIAAEAQKAADKKFKRTGKGARRRVIEQHVNERKAARYRMKADTAKSVGKTALKYSSPVITLGSAAYDLWAGERPGKVLTITAAGVVLAPAAEAVALATIPVTGPMAVVVAGGTAFGTGWSIDKAYDNMLSKQTREKIEEKGDDFNEWVSETGEDIKNGWKDFTSKRHLPRLW